MEQLIDLVAAHPGATGTSVVINGPRPDTPGLVVELTPGGRVRLPHAGLDLVAVGLTTDEAQGCAALLAATHHLQDVPVPVDEDATDGLARLHRRSRRPARGAHPAAGHPRHRRR